MHARRALPVVFAALILAAVPAPAQVPITGGGTYTQNFDNPPNAMPTSGSITWAQNSTIPGWYAVRTGTGTTSNRRQRQQTAPGTCTASAAGTQADRALGSVGSGNVAAGNFAWGVVFRNDGGLPLNDRPSLTSASSGATSTASVADGQLHLQAVEHRDHRVPPSPRPMSSGDGTFNTYSQTELRQSQFGGRRDHPDQRERQPANHGRGQPTLPPGPASNSIPESTSRCGGGTRTTSSTRPRAGGRRPGHHLHPGAGAGHGARRRGGRAGASQGGAPDAPRKGSPRRSIGVRRSAERSDRRGSARRLLRPLPDGRGSFTRPPDRKTSSNREAAAANAATSVGSNCPGDSAVICRTARAWPSAGRCGRRDRSASYTDATATARAASGISGPGQPVRVAGPVPPLVVVPHHLRRQRQVRQRHRQPRGDVDEHLRPEDRVRLDDRVLVRGRAGPASSGRASAGRACPTSWTGATAESMARNRSVLQPRVLARGPGPRRPAPAGTGRAGRGSPAGVRPVSSSSRHAPKASGSAGERSRSIRRLRRRRGRRRPNQVGHGRPGRCPGPASRVWRAEVSAAGSGGELARRQSRLRRRDRNGGRGERLLQEVVGPLQQAVRPAPPAAGPPR